jgi:hypothetical protein
VLSTPTARQALNSPHIVGLFCPFSRSLLTLVLSAQHDSIIFSLALLLSSNFIYNSVGSIDEGALNNLSLVVNLTSTFSKIKVVSLVAVCM